MQFEFLFNRERKAQPEGEWLRVGTRHIRLLFARHPRARRYVLRLCSDGTARVTIPRGGSFAEARRFTNRNLGWLQKQLLRQASRPAEPKIWTVGTEILFRGETVRLEVTHVQQAAVIRFADEVVRLPIQSRGFADTVPDQPLALETEGLTHTSPGQRPGIIALSFLLQAEGLPHNPSSNTRPPIAFTVPTCPQILHEPRNRRREEANASPHTGTRPVPASQSPPSTNLRPSVEKHLWQLASRELTARVAELAKQHGFHVHRVTVRNQRSRWGSCSKRGTISLNWRLVQTPPFVRDYIILHELAHLKEMNHSRRFWREAARLCPDFSRAERWLKEQAGLFR